MRLYISITGGFLRCLDCTGTRARPTQLVTDSVWLWTGCSTAKKLPPLTQSFRPLYFWWEGGRLLWIRLSISTSSTNSLVAGRVYLVTGQWVYRHRYVATILRRIEQISFVLNDGIVCVGSESYLWIDLKFYN